MYVIVGLGAAGAAAAAAIRRLDASTPVTIVTNEEDRLYSRVDLPDVLAGKLDSRDAVLKTAEEFRAQGIDLISGLSVTSIQPAAKSLELADGRSLHYSQLLLALGSRSIVPEIPGVNLAGVHTLWTMAQVQELIQAAKQAKKAVVVGSGLIGLKTALALAQRGLKVTVVEKLARVMPRQLDDTGAGIIAAALNKKGVEVKTGAQVEAVVGEAGKVTGVIVDGQPLAAEIVVMAVGVRPCVDLAENAGIVLGRGIKVDDKMQTSIPGIFAAGDCAEIIDPCTGRSVVPAIWPAAVGQGETAAVNMTGGTKAYTSANPMNAVEVAGIPLVSAGDPDHSPDDEVVSLRKADRYRKVVIRDGVIRGVVFVGDVRQAGVLVNFCQKGQAVGGMCLDSSLNYVDLLAI